MIIEDYVSFETAKLLKEKGFDVPCMGRYSARSKEFHLDCTKMCNNGGLFECAAPSQAMAMKWLREVHKLSVRPRYDEVEDEKERVFYVWFFDILSMKPYKMLAEPEQGYSTYEEACEAAIKYCLENLI